MALIPGDLWTDPTRTRYAIFTAGDVAFLDGDNSCGRDHVGMKMKTTASVGTQVAARRDSAKLSTNLVKGS